MKFTLTPRLLVGIFLVLAVAAPLVLPTFHITLMNYIGLYALVALGLVLLTGVGGLTSFGQAAFVGLGAYTTAVLTTQFNASPWLGLIAGIVITLGVAFILGALTLRLSGHYLPLGTIAWGISLYFLFGTMETLGGHTGLSGIPPISILGWALDEGQEIFYLILCFLLLAMLATSNLLDSREGRRHSCSERRARDGRSNGREYPTLTYDHLFNSCPVRLCFWLVVCTYAAFSESNAFRFTQRH